MIDPDFVHQLISFDISISSVRRRTLRSEESCTPCAPSLTVLQTSQPTEQEKLDPSAIEVEKFCSLESARVIKKRIWIDSLDSATPIPLQVSVHQRLLSYQQQPRPPTLKPWHRAALRPCTLCSTALTAWAWPRAQDRWTSPTPQKALGPRLPQGCKFRWRTPQHFELAPCRTSRNALRSFARACASHKSRRTSPTDRPPQCDAVWYLAVSIVYMNQHQFQSECKNLRFGVIN